VDSAHWQRLQQLFHAALEQPAAARAGFLDRACGGDGALRAAVERLLVQDATTDEPVQRAIEQAAAQFSHDTAAARVGQRLGAWRLGTHLADGGMGAVYLAERDDGQYTQRAAIKLLNPAFASEEAKARLEAERQILARLAHPHIARLLDGGRTDDGVPYLVMEYVDGVPIDRWCDQQRLDTRARLRLFAQVCRAVDHAHRNLIVHRDLKPSNILVDAQGVPRLLDFGIAKLLQGGASVTRASERVLTPSHASPEQIVGGTLTTATDVYSLGVLLYDLLTGRSPYGADDTPPAEMARCIVETDPPRPSTAVSDGSGRRLAEAQQRGERLSPQRLKRELAGDLDNIVLMALRKDPARRYVSAEALAEDIDRVLAHLPVRARPDTLAYRAAKFVRRHRVAVPVSLLVAFAVLLGATGFTWRLALERQQAEREAVRANRVADFMAGVFSVADPRVNLGETVTARELLDNAAGQVARDLQDEPLTQAALRRSIGAAYLGLGLYPDARKQFEQAQTLSERLHGASSADAAEDRSRFGDVLKRMGEYDAAVTALRQALQVQAALPDGGGLQRVRTLRWLGEALWQQGRDYAAARAALREAVDRSVALGEPADADRADAMTSLSDFLSFRGDQAAALGWAEKSLALNRRLFGDEHPRTQESHRALGVVYLRQDRYADAVAEYESSLRLARRIYGNDHLRTAYLLANLGNVLTQMGQFARAEAVTREALKVFEHRLAPGHPRIAFLTENLANAIIDQGAARHEEALALYRASLDQVRRYFGPDHAETGYSTANLAGAYRRMGRDADALPLAQEAVRILKAAMGPVAPTVASAYNKLASIQINLRRYRDAAASLAAGEAVADAASVPAVHSIREGQLELHAGIELGEGRPAAAEPLLQAAHAVLVQSNGDADPATREAAEALELLHRARGQP